jgi:serine/threonine protein kinase
MDSTGDAARSIQGYEIIETLGQGGFGTVYRARQLAVGREVALKIDSRVLITDRDKRRFMREVTAAGHLSDHPHVVAVYDAGVLDDGRPHIVFELCPNGSLADRLRERGAFAAAEVRDIGVQIADALTAAHAMGILHRDVKPANILVNRYGGVALADFGLATMPTPGVDSTATREALTPAYAPPEVFDLAEPTLAGDVYSLGATLYALLSGRPPFFPPEGRPSMVALMAARLGPVPDIPGAPPGLVAVLQQAMAYDPADRPAGAAVLRDALAGADLSPPPDGGARRSVPTGPGRHRSATGRAPVATTPNHEPGPSVPATSTGPDPAGEATAPGGRRSLRSRTLLAAAVAVAIVAIVALIAYSVGGSGRHDGAGATTRTPGAVTGVKHQGPYGSTPTTTEDCPAASVTGADARCTKTAECWEGIVAINGDVTINRSDCAAAHVFETFAIAPLPAGAQTWNQHLVVKQPVVGRVCSRAVMMRSRHGAALKVPAGSWSVAVVPPSHAQFDGEHLRTYRCVASVTGRPFEGSAFRPS